MARATMCRGNCCAPRVEQARLSRRSCYERRRTCHEEACVEQGARMRLVLFALLIAVGLAPSAARALPMPPDEPTADVPVTAAAERSGGRDFFWETELYCMTLAVYFEGGS